MRLENKVALITGGYGGMGRASVRLFAKEGAAVVVAGRNHDRGNTLVTEITDGGGKALFVELEVTEQDQWSAAVAQVLETFGALHILMNIVGSNDLVMLPEVDIDAWNKMFEINVTATLRGIVPEEHPSTRFQGHPLLWRRRKWRYGSRGAGGRRGPCPSRSSGVLREDSPGCVASAADRRRPAARRHSVHRRQLVLCCGGADRGVRAQHTRLARISMVAAPYANPLRRST